MILSIITVHLNDFLGLQQTLVSLQRTPQWTAMQWVVVDGGSDFNQSEEGALLKQLLELADFFISEPDDGIYDAMNKGTSLVKGDYVLYLNAGDELHSEFDWQAIQEQMNSNLPAMVWGTCFERFPTGELVKVKNRNPALAWYGMPVNHQNVLFRRDLLSNTPYDTKFQICADYDLICSILKSGGNVFRSVMPISIFQKGGINERNFKQTMDEETVLRVKHFGMHRFISVAISRIKFLTSQMGKSPALRRQLRRWV